jgi:hypothetical protein
MNEVKLPVHPANAGTPQRNELPDPRGPVGRSLTDLPAEADSA